MPLQPSCKDRFIFQSLKVSIQRLAIQRLSLRQQKTTSLEVTRNLDSLRLQLYDIVESGSQLCSTNLANTDLRKNHRYAWAWYIHGLESNLCYYEENMASSHVLPLLQNSVLMMTGVKSESCGCLYTMGWTSGTRFYLPPLH